MNNTDRETQLAKLKMIQMINTYLSVGIFAMLAAGTYGIGWLIAQLVQAIL